MDQEATTRLWHSFADMAEVLARGEVVLARGAGTYLEDESGRRYLDASGGPWFCHVGHGRRRLAEAAALQRERSASQPSPGDLATRPALDLAERLAAIAPMADARVVFTSGGSDSVDTAANVVRRYWALMGQPDRGVVVTRRDPQHGMDLGDHGVQVAWDDAEALEALLAERDDIGAFFCEPVMGEGGVYAPPPGYLDRVRDMCRRHDVLFVADEVITGYGRTGRMFASERWGLDPDIVLTAQGITSGYAPLGAVLVSGRVAEPFRSPARGPAEWEQGYPHTVHATACAVALVNLDIMEEEQLVERVARLQHVLGNALARLASYDIVSEVRGGVGLLSAIDFTLQAKADGVPMRVLAALRDAGVITRTLASGAVQVSPPFVIDEDGIGLLTRALDTSLEVAGGTDTRPPASGLLPDITSDEGVDAYDDSHYLEARPPHHG